MSKEIGAKVLLCHVLRRPLAQQSPKMVLNLEIHFLADSIYQV